MYRGFFDGMEEVEAGERGAIKYVPEALLSEAVREAQERIARTEFSLKVAMVTDDERVRAAKLEVFVREIANAPFTIDAFRYWRHQAVLLTHLKAASTEGGKGGAALRSTPVKEEDKP
jgi:hypothetical protein